jgi:hypothetical protein
LYRTYLHYCSRCTSRADVSGDRKEWKTADSSKTDHGFDQAAQPYLAAAAIVACLPNVHKDAHGQMISTASTAIVIVYRWEDRKKNLAVKLIEGDIGAII